MRAHRKIQVVIDDTATVTTATVTLRFPHAKVGDKILMDIQFQWPNGQITRETVDYEFVSGVAR